MASGRSKGRLGVVVLVLGAVVLVWLAMWHGGGGAPRSEPEADVAAALDAAKPREALRQAKQLEPAGDVAEEVGSGREPDPHDAPIELDEAALRRRASERGLALVQRNIDDLTKKAAEAERSGNSAHAELMRRRIEALKERRAVLQAERDAHAAAAADDDDGDE